MDSTDVSNFASSYYESAVAPGQIAKPSYDFDVGFCGYRFNSETANYTVRFRHYDPGAGLGRWLERDPAGYRDGASLYQYGDMNPAAGSDPMGLERGWDPVRDYQQQRRNDAAWGQRVINDICIKGLDVTEIAVEQAAWELSGLLSAELIARGFELIANGGKVVAGWASGGIGFVVGKRGYAKAATKAAEEIVYVIGEGQNSVNDWAHSRGFRTISDWMKDNGITTWNTSVNDQFIKELIENGSQVRDIGPLWPRRRELSSTDAEEYWKSIYSYSRERRQLKDYPYRIKEFDRTGPFSGERSAGITSGTSELGGCNR